MIFQFYDLDKSKRNKIIIFFELINFSNIINALFLNSEFNDFLILIKLLYSVKQYKVIAQKLQILLSFYLVYVFSKVIT
jgi:hypothetical protein